MFNEAVIGSGRAETIGRACHRALDFGCQPGQPGQQIALVPGIAVTAHLVHEVRKLTFSAGKQCPDLLRHREGQQGGHPVSLDLQQALNRASGLACGERRIDHHEARPAIGEQKVGKDPGRTVGDLGRDELPAGSCRELLHHRGRRHFSGRTQLDVGRHQQTAGNVGDPFLRYGRERPPGGIVAGPRGAEERVARELGVPFPLQAKGVEVENQVLALGFGQGLGEGLAEFAKVVELFTRAHAPVGDRQV